MRQEFGGRDSDITRGLDAYIEGRNDPSFWVDALLEPEPEICNPCLGNDCDDCQDCLEGKYEL